MDIRLNTERLLLRPIVLEDAPYILAQLNDPGWIENIGDRNVHTLEEAEAYIETKILKPTDEDDKGPFFVVVRKEDPEQAIIGQCGIFKRDGLQHQDIGFSFLSPYCGQGYGYEASKAVLDHVRTHYGLTNLCAITTVSNIPSQKLLEKLGLKHAGQITLPNDDEELMLYEL